MTTQCIGCCQDTVFSGDFIAKELDRIGDKWSGDTTIADMQTCLESFKNISLRAACFIYEAVWW
jgi:hypothetical protein